MQTRLVWAAIVSSSCTYYPAGALWGFGEHPPRCAGDAACLQIERAFHRYADGWDLPGQQADAKASVVALGAAAVPYLTAALDRHAWQVSWLAARWLHALGEDAPVTRWCSGHRDDIRYEWTCLGRVPLFLYSL